MDSWERLERAIVDHATTVIGDEYTSEFIVFSGGWHLWAEVGERLGDDDQVVGHEFVMTAAAVPPAEPDHRQRQAMEAAGWRYDPAGPGFERQVLTKEPPEGRLASTIIATLRDHLGVPLDQPHVGPTETWGSLPGVPPPTEEELLAVEELFSRFEVQRAEREAREALEAPHKEASALLYARAQELREANQPEIDKARQADDPHRLARHLAIEGLGLAAARAAGDRLYDERLQEPTVRVIELLEAGTLEGAWELLHVLFEHTQAAADVHVARHHEWVRARDRERETAVSWVDVAVSEPPGSGHVPALQWHHSQVTAVAIAGPRDGLVEALKRGVLAAGDVGYALAPFPRGWNTACGGFRREVLKEAKRVAVVTDRDRGTYLPPSLWD